MSSETQGNVTLDMILEKIRAYQPDADTAKIVRAYQFAEQAHRGQARISGEAYIIHPLHVAYILTGLHMDDETICAALLHDVVEDMDWEKMRPRTQWWRSLRRPFDILSRRPGQQ